MGDKSGISWTDATWNPVVGCSRVSAGCEKVSDGRSRYGEENNNWRGGRIVASNGYVLVRVGIGHHLADIRGYAYEHRLVAERILGRELKTGEVVHHKDGNKQNNSPENLDICESIAHHRSRHRKGHKSLRLPGEVNPLVRCACGCGTELRRYDPQGRARSYVTGHNLAKRTGKGDGPHGR